MKGMIMAKRAPKSHPRIVVLDEHGNHLVLASTAKDKAAALRAVRITGHVQRTGTVVDLAASHHANGEQAWHVYVFKVHAQSAASPKTHPGKKAPKRSKKKRAAKKGKRAKK